MEPLPEHLSHKPVYAMSYINFDGIYIGKTDVRYISVGLSTWNPADASIKVFRYVNNRWTRQAEELPLHRIIDMTLFLALTIGASSERSFTIPASTFTKQTHGLSIGRDLNRSAGEMASFDGFLLEHDELLKQRLGKLADVLIELRQADKI